MKKHLINTLLLLGALLSVYGFMQKQFGLFTCETDGCAIADSLLKIDSSILYIFAFLFFVGLIAIKNLKIFSFLKDYFNILFYSGLAFEIVLFSNMFFVYGEFCKECAKMVALLIIIGLVLDPKKIFIPIAIAVAMFILNPIEEEVSFTNELTLITKVDCPFCKEVKEYLNTNNIEYKEVNYKKTLGFLNSFEIKSVPALVLKKDNQIKILKGKSTIKECINEEFLNQDKKNEVFEIGNSNFGNIFQPEVPSNDDTVGCKIESEEGCEI